MGELRAGLARTRITPPPRSYLIGYGERMLPSRGVHDDLFATALVLDDGGQRIAILTLDLLALHEDVVARLRRDACAATGVPSDAILVACSHTHAGPIAWAGPRSAPWRRRQVERLVAKAVHALTQATKTLEPVKLSVGYGEAKVAVNRRERSPDGRIVLGVNREGFRDPRVAVLRLTDPGGAPRASVVSFTCHPTVLSPRNRLVSAEWPGVLRRQVEERTGASCLFLQGGTGDLAPNHVWGEDDFLAMERIGTAVADAALASVEAGGTPVAATPLTAVRERIELPVELNRGSDGGVEPYPVTAQRAFKVPSFLVDPLLRFAYPWRPRLRVGPDGRASLAMEIQALRLGDVAILAHAAETFNELAAELCQRSPAPHTFFAGYANGMVGYLPTAAAVPEGGYEVDEALLPYRVPGRFEAGAGEAALERSLAVLQTAFPA